MDKQRAAVEIEIPGPCVCPGSPHEDGDRAWFRPRLRPEDGFLAVSLIRRSFVDTQGDDATIDLDTAEAKAEASLAMLYLVGGLVRWTLVDEQGAPVPCTEDVIRSGRVDWATVLFPLADAADDLYGADILAPLRPRTPQSSSSGQTAASTSAMSGSSSPPPKPSKPSTTQATRKRRQTG